MRRTMARNLAEQLDWFADNREYAGKVDGQWPVLASRDSCTRSAALCGPMAGRGHGVLFDDPDAFIASMDTYVRPLVPPPH